MPKPRKLNGIQRKTFPRRKKKMVCPFLVIAS
jgi:hypothetical protein